MWKVADGPVPGWIPFLVSPRGIVENFNQKSSIVLHIMVVSVKANPSYHCRCKAVKSSNL